MYKFLYYESSLKKLLTFDLSIMQNRFHIGPVCTKNEHHGQVVNTLASYLGGPMLNFSPETPVLTETFCVCPQTLHVNAG
jgi:hypothetical protein